jgi:glyoxalase family protein
MAIPDNLELTGIHHVSSISGDLPINRDFYTSGLGLRLVKKSVNQDATSMYHLFYADGRGTPGTDVTFFDYPGAGPNRNGNGEVAEIGLRVTGDGVLKFWQDRFTAMGVDQDPITERAGFPALPFRDKEGHRLALIQEPDDSPTPPGTPWELSTVPPPNSILGLSTVTLAIPSTERTIPFMTDQLGFRLISDEAADTGNAGDRDLVLELGNGGANATALVQVRPNLGRSRLGAGGVHHVAWRVADADQLAAWQQYLETFVPGVTPLIDRFYFQSVYFREPSGILFELATDGPGFHTDEPVETMGTGLALPPFLEPHRAQIEANLRPLDTSIAIQTRPYPEVVTPAGAR